MVLLVSILGLINIKNNTLFTSKEIKAKNLSSDSLFEKLKVKGVVSGKDSSDSTKTGGGGGWGV